MPIDCDAVLFEESADGGTFARLLGGVDDVFGPFYQEISASVSGLVAGVPYEIRFEQSIVRHLGQSSGRFDVEFAGLLLQGPVLARPSGNPEQGPWERVAVGPFVASGSNTTLIFRPVSNEDGSGGSPTLPDFDGGCLYSSDSLVVDLLLDGIEIVGDSDIDGLYDDEEALYGTDPSLPDTDGDGLDDLDEVEIGTNPLVTDSDNDDIEDGEEIAAGTDPLDPDTDRDGLTDGHEREVGLDPLDPDTDGDGMLDGSDSDPANAPTTVPSSDSGAAESEDPKREGSESSAGCGCQTRTLRPPLVWVGLAGLLARRRAFAR